jgi:hypothetical protein
VSKEALLYPVDLPILPARKLRFYRRKDCSSRQHNQRGHSASLRIRPLGKQQSLASGDRAHRRDVYPRSGRKFLFRERHAHTHHRWGVDLACLLEDTASYPRRVGTLDNAEGRSVQIPVIPQPCCCTFETVGNREGTNGVRGSSNGRTLREKAPVPHNRSQTSSPNATCGKPFHLPSRSNPTDDAPAFKRACGDGFPSISGGTSERGCDSMIRFHLTASRSHEFACQSECGDRRLHERDYVSVHW